MLQKLVVALVCAISFVQVNAFTQSGPINVYRDMSSSIQPNPNVQPFGCVVLRRADGNGGTPYLSVSGGASGSDCAQFEWTSVGNNGEYRYKELSLGKLMTHSSGSDWIYVDGDVNDASSDTLFKYETYQYTNNGESHPTLRPVTSDNVIYAQYDSGDLNVKNSGFKMFLR